MESRLLEATNTSNSKVYIELFIWTNTLTPFTSDKKVYRLQGFQKGSSYSLGLIEGEYCGFGLHNDKENEE